MKNPSQLFFLSLGDFLEKIEKERKKLLLLFLVFVFCGFFFFLLKPVSYTSEAIFKTNASNDVTALAKTIDILYGAESSSSLDKEAIFLLDSYGVLEEVVKKLHLQGFLSPAKKEPFYKRMGKNLILESIFSKFSSKKPLPSPFLNNKLYIPDQSFEKEEVIIHLSALSYEADISTQLQILFNDAETFSVYTKEKKLLGHGKIGIPFLLQQGTFTLTGKGGKKLRYHLSLFPLKSCVKLLSKNLTIKKIKKKPSFIRINCTTKDPKLSSDIVNLVMESYQNYLMERAKEKLCEHLTYLTKRKEEAEVELKNLLQEYENYLNAHIEKGGFLLLNEEVNYLTEKQAKLNEEKLLLRMKMQKIGADADVESRQNLTQSEISFFSLEQAEIAFEHYLQELNTLELQNEHFCFALDNLTNPDIDTSSLIKMLNEPSLAPLFEQVRTFHSQLVDNKNWSEKEKEWIKEELSTKRLSLQKELIHLKAAKELQIQVLRKKMEPLQKSYLTLLSEQYRKVEQSLRDLAEQEKLFPEKLSQLQKIELKTKIIISIIEQLSKTIEGRSANLKILDSFPLEKATISPLPNSPHLLLKSFLLGLFSLFCYLAYLILHMLYTGPKATKSNLEKLNFNVLGSLSSQQATSFRNISQEDQSILKKLSYVLSSHTERKNRILFTAQTPLSFLPAFFELVGQKKEKIAFVNLHEEKDKKGLTDYLMHTLTTDFSYQNEHIKIYPLGCKSLFHEELLLSPSFSQFLNALSEEYDWVFINSIAHPTSLETKIVSSHCDLTVFFASSEMVRDLSGLPDRSLFITEKRERKTFKNFLNFLKTEKEIYLKQAGPMIDSLQEKMLPSIAD